MQYTQLASGFSADENFITRCLRCTLHCIRNNKNGDYYHTEIVKNYEQSTCTEIFLTLNIMEVSECIEHSWMDDALHLPVAWQHSFGYVLLCICIYISL